MSYYNTSSFDSNEYNDRVWTPFGSSQSTQTTNSSFDYGNAVVPQPGNNASDHNLLENVGYGAPDAYGAIAPNPNFGFGSVYVPAVGTSLPNQYEYNTSYYAGPWSQYTRWKAHGPDPYPVTEAATAQRSQRLAPDRAAEQVFQRAPTSSLPSSRDDGRSEQWHGGLVYDHTDHGVVSEASLPSLSSRPGMHGQSNKLLLPPMQMLPGNEVEEVRYLCPEPECPELFTRPDDVRRHQKTKHSKGPFWKCDICGILYNQVRIDNMRRHCRNKHPNRIEYDLIKNEDVYPFRLVASDDGKCLTSKTSTADKRTRRRRHADNDYD